MSEYITVVFKCGKNSQTRIELMNAFRDDDPSFGDVEITAISLDDEISRVEQYEEAVSNIKKNASWIQR